MKKLFLPLLLWVAALAGCAGAPEGVVAVDNFKLDRYLGTWYEIARIDNRFERGSDHVSAKAQGFDVSRVKRTLQ